MHVHAHSSDGFRVFEGPLLPHVGRPIAIVADYTTWKKERLQEYFVWLSGLPEVELCWRRVRLRSLAPQALESLRVPAELIDGLALQIAKDHLRIHLDTLALAHKWQVLPVFELSEVDRSRVLLEWMGHGRPLVSSVYENTGSCALQEYVDAIRQMRRIYDSD